MERENLLEVFLNKNSYSGSRDALKLLAKMNDDEKIMVLSNQEVQKVILSIENGEILKNIFRKSPAFFQEIMFSSEHIQDILISPDKLIDRNSFFANYNVWNYNFKDESIRKLEAFIHTIKSPLVKSQLIENKLFQRIVVLCSERQLKKSFFRTIDEVQLFYNIISDPDIYDTKIWRKKNIINVFNNVSDHILLPDDFNDVIPSFCEFVRYKSLVAQGFPRTILDDRTFKLFNKDMLESLLDISNLDHKPIENVLHDDILKSIVNVDNDFSKIFSSLSWGDYDSFRTIYFQYFKIIMEECSNEVRINFIDFIFNILCSTEELDENDKKTIKDMIYHKINSNMISKDEYKNLFYRPNSRKTIFYLRFGFVLNRMNYLDGITTNQLMNVNIKHVNQILNALHVENEDEISNIYAYAIKMYLTFGLERTLSILRSEYGNLDRTFFDNLSRLDTHNVELIKEGKKFIPNIKSDFISFMFANNKDNHFKEMLADHNSLLYKNWSYLYNNLEELKERCHGVLTLKKLNIIFKELSPTRDIKDITPDNYKLRENNILNDVCLGNKTSHTNEVIYKKLLDIYDEMKKRYESSIPYVKGNCSNGYTYEMMKLNDPIAFTLGYKGNCCIRVGDIAHKHLLHATLCRNGRILLIYDENHNLAGFVPLKRNGELLIANSIECTHKVKNDLAIGAFSDAINDIVLTTSKSSEPINLVCIGSEAYARPEGSSFPKEIATPTIYEKYDTRYQNTDEYHKELTIIYKNKNVDLKSIKFGNPSVSYQDPRNKVRSCDFHKSSNEEKKETLEVIDSIRYANANIDELEDFLLCRSYLIDNCIYNDDWYLLTTYDGCICGDYLRNDERALKEFNIAVLEMQSKKCEIRQENISPLILKYR